MNYETNRLQTFQEWPANSPVSPGQIAKAGFYYTGQARTVQCFLCGITISEWNRNDKVITQHRQASPECQFVLEPFKTCNVPLISSFNETRHSSSVDGDTQDLRRWRILQIETMNYYERLSTFKNWPVPDIVSPKTLAKSGFIYFKQADLVKCIYCKGKLRHWVLGDVPDDEHRKHFPNCDFYLREEENEINLSTEQVDFDNVKLLPGTTSNFTELRIQNHLAPKQPKHATYEGRLHTFQGWPTDLKQTPEMLADAGFYYLGSQDQVRCFHCGGGLRNWEENDDVWIEHARWFPKCGYTVLVRGQDFIKQCVESTQPSKPSILASALNDVSDVSVIPSASPTVISQQRHIRRVTDAELEGLLGTAPAVAALEIGLHVGRVKMALKRRMEQTGLPYVNADQLIEDATQIQLREEDNIINRASDSPSTELTHLLNQIISTAESASSSNVQPETARNNESKEGSKLHEIATSTSEIKSQNELQTEDGSTIHEETVSLAEENRRLKESRLCRVCMDKEFSVVFLPCSHLSTCVFCASSLTHCPMCRQAIRATVRTFLT